MTTEIKQKLAKEFAEVINRNSAEHYANTPDYILGEYLVNCFELYSQSVRQRDSWYHESRKGSQKNTQ